MLADLQTYMPKGLNPSRAGGAGAGLVGLIGVVPLVEIQYS